MVFQGGFFCLGRSFPFPSLIGFFYASAAECVLGTGRVLGDVGQATFVGSPGQLLVGLIM